MKFITIAVFLFSFSTLAFADWRYALVQSRTAPGESLAGTFDEVPRDDFQEIGVVEYVSGRHIRLVAINPDSIATLKRRFTDVNFIWVDELATFAFQIESPDFTVEEMKARLRIPGKSLLTSSLETLRTFAFYSPTGKEFDAEIKALAAREIYNVIAELASVEKEMARAQKSEDVASFQTLILDLVALLKTFNTDQSRELLMMVGERSQWAALSAISASKEDERLYFDGWLASFVNGSNDLTSFYSIPVDDPRIYQWHFTSFIESQRFEYVDASRKVITATQNGAGLPIPMMRKPIHSTGLLFLVAGKNRDEYVSGFVTSFLIAEKAQTEGMSQHRRNWGAGAPPTATFGTPLLDDAIVTLTDVSQFAAAPVPLQQNYMNVVMAILVKLVPALKTKDLAALVAERAIYFLHQSEAMTIARKAGGNQILRSQLADALITRDWKELDIRFRCNIQTALGRFLIPRG